MDLNRLYFDHQISLMRAAASPCANRRRHHRAQASATARSIEGIHRASGASALGEWEAKAA